MLCMLLIDWIDVFPLYQPNLTASHSTNFTRWLIHINSYELPTHDPAPNLMLASEPVFPTEEQIFQSHACIIFML